MAAGSSSATAVPDVVTTATGAAKANVRPRAKKAALRSSGKLHTRNPGERASTATNTALRAPAQTITSHTP